MRRWTQVALAVIVLVLLWIWLAPRIFEQGGSKTTARTTSSAPSASKRAAPSEDTLPMPIGRPVGFTSQRALEEHFEKHNREFGLITRDDYLLRARSLRDAPVGGPILEAVREDGVITRFDIETGAFIAFNPNRTIRTFFKPNDGKRYFERQLERKHQ